MPKSRLAEAARNQAPPIDWLWAAVLERKLVLGYDLKTLSKIAGVTYDTFRQYITRSPWTWPESARNNVCKALGIKPIQTVQPAPSNEWGLME